MPFWVHGRDAATGQPRAPLFVEAESAADARQQAAEAGMAVEEAEFVRPAAPSIPLRCPRCDSGRVVPRATVWDQDTGAVGGGPLRAYVNANPGALIFRGPVYAALYARVCADCGHAELFADGAGELYEAYRRSRNEHDPQ
ncbi:MAG: hypothetical protein J0I06_16815 [Planctomycetes bacterium]|nr:hypothetical protein [Planctomycetota bacterium]